MSGAKNVDAENENFTYNDMLARALVQLFPPEERYLINLWLEKLQSTKGDEEVLSTRNNYMWLLLSVLQHSTLCEPFDKAPPIGDLPPVSEIMPPQMIEEMLFSADEGHAWIDRVFSDPEMSNEREMQNNGMPPYKFLEHQPRPVDGITCYFSVFSKQT